MLSSGEGEREGGLGDGGQEHVAAQHVEQEEEDGADFGESSCCDNFHSLDSYVVAPLSIQMFVLIFLSCFNFTMDHCMSLSPPMPLAAPLDL